jgi:hypothetical protein
MLDARMKNHGLKWRRSCPAAWLRPAWRRVAVELSGLRVEVDHAAPTVTTGRESSTPAADARFANASNAQMLPSAVAASRSTRVTGRSHDYQSLRVPSLWHRGRRAHSQRDCERSNGELCSIDAIGDDFEEQAVEDEKDFIPTTYENCDRITGPFYHGTAAVLKVGDVLAPGFSSNYQKGRISNHIYFSTTVAGLAAELAAALAGVKGRGHVYIVEPTGRFEDDPNVTNKRFRGNPTK